MSIVVDTSVILAVVLNEPSKSTLVDLTTNAELVAPPSLHWEVGNALSAMLKRQHLTLEEGYQALVAYQNIAIRFLDVSLDDTLRIAAAHTIYAYDAYFIACALAQHAPLLTLDHGLYLTAQRAGISVLETT